MRLRFALAFLFLASPALAQFQPPAIPPPASVTPAMLASDAPSDNECLTYDLATTSFIWDTCATGGSGAPTDAEYIVAEAHSGLSAEVAPGGANQVPVSSSSTAAAWGTVPDAALANNYSGVGSCSTGGGVTATVDNAAPTCNAHVMFDDEASTVTQDMTFSDGSGDSPALTFTPQTGTAWSILVNDAVDDLTIQSASTASTETVRITNPSGAGVADLHVEGMISATNMPVPPADDQVLVGLTATSAQWKTVADCQDTGSNHLNYTQSSNTFSCGTSVASNAGTAGQGLFSAGASAPVWTDAKRLVRLTSNYTNATTSLTNTALTWGPSPNSVSRSIFDCILVVSSSATTLGTQFDVTVSVAPTTISYRLDWIAAVGTLPGTGGTVATVNANANSTLVGPTAGLTANTVWRLTGVIVHTSSPATTTIRARASSAGTVTILSGSSCEYNVQS